ncbi:MAG: hypothetical protein KBC30_04720 [Planctomycetes bacterium]|jgi:uncharacterized protein YcfL|nr:hypothetical protein [Planctomycetota bacterium]HNZ67299.1 hypothetical protein [Planctomycetota bacterium]HON44816.1 hypothetical protein [Planctomycetota bacterium]HPY74011.1 hypothetical protein [Planctomycetota bacterium]HQB01188.1 hypothetical protein [Planctomycetota bacterium]
MKKFFIIIIIPILCVACKNTNQLQNSIDLQQQTINEMQNRIHKLELEQEQTRQNMETLQRDYKKATEEIKKVQPKYVDGSIQESY